jgi:hypothetical protein
VIHGVRTTPALCLTLGLALPASICGQGDPTSQEDLIARKAAALDKPFRHAANWFVDFSAAKAEATRTNKPIFAYFSRSYRP